MAKDDAGAGHTVPARLDAWSAPRSLFIALELSQESVYVPDSQARM